jgi:ketol-acid reductoisomerase
MRRQVYHCSNGNKFQPDYREKLNKELEELRESEMWQAGKTVRSLRPENQK